MPPITDVVKNLIIINVVLFFGIRYAMPNLLPYFILYFPDTNYDLFKPLQLVTHMFMHGNTMHLLFNMYALYLFGSALENYWGPQRFLKFYFICGFGAIAMHLGVWSWELSNLSQPEYMRELGRGVVGASGAIFGLLAGFGTVFPNVVLSLIFPPISMKAKYFVLIYAGIELYLGVNGIQSGVAHFAHLGGALFGFLLVKYWQRGGKLI